MHRKQSARESINRHYSAVQLSDFTTECSQLFPRVFFKSPSLAVRRAGDSGTSQATAPLQLGGSTSWVAALAGQQHQLGSSTASVH